MCGICGFISTKRITEQELKALNNVMSHRGPDDAGILQWTAKDGYNIGFGHRRLSVIDLSIAGHQPMSCIDQEGHTILTVVFNGEIYNYTRLKNQLKDFMFKTNTDTEVILASYLKWGDQFLEHLQECLRLRCMTTEMSGLFSLGIGLGKSHCTIFSMVMRLFLHLN